MFRKAQEESTKPKYRIDISLTINEVKADDLNKYSSVIRVPASLSVSVNANDLFEAISVLDRIKSLVQPG